MTLVILNNLQNLLIKSDWEILRVGRGEGVQGYAVRYQKPKKNC